MPERVQPLVRQRQVVVARPGALGHHHDRRVPGLEPVLHVLTDLVQAERPLGDEDHVRPAGQSRVQRDPARVPAHHLDHHHPVMGGRGGVQAVERLHHDADRGVEPDAEVGRRQVVVNGLGNADGRVSGLVQRIGHRERVVAADRDQAVDPVLLQAAEHPSDAIHLLQGIGSRRTEHGAPEREDAPDVRRDQVRHVAAQRPRPAVLDAADVVAELKRPPRHAADRSVQARRIATPGEDPHAHSAPVSVNAALGRRRPGG